MSKSGGSAVLALVTGLAIGAGLGILYAPDKGAKTRVKLKEGYDDTKNNLKTKYDAAAEELKQKVSNFKQNKLQATYEDMLSNVSHKTEDVISFLEEKLATLKEQNAKLQK